MSRSPICSTNSSPRRGFLFKVDLARMYGAVGVVISRAPETEILLVLTRAQNESQLKATRRGTFCNQLANQDSFYLQYVDISPKRAVTVPYCSGDKYFSFLKMSRSAILISHNRPSILSYGVRCKVLVCRGLCYSPPETTQAPTPHLFLGKISCVSLLF